MNDKTCGQKVTPLKVGDRVEAIGDVGVLNLKGNRGVVRYVMNLMAKRVLVEFDKPITLGHDGGDGSCKDGHGWWGRHEDFRVIKAEKKAKKKDLT